MSEHTAEFENISQDLTERLKGGQAEDEIDVTFNGSCPVMNQAYQR